MSNYPDGSGGETYYTSEKIFCPECGHVWHVEMRVSHGMMDPVDDMDMLCAECGSLGE